MAKEIVDNSFVKINRVHPVTNVIFTVILSLFAVTTILPMVLVFSISISTSQSLKDAGYSLFPTEITFTAYESLFKTGTQLLDSYIVTISVTIISTVVGILVMSMYAYVLANKRFAPRKVYTFIPFFTMLFSGGLVPSYMVNVKLGLPNTIWILILTGIVGAFNIIILRTFISATIPEEMMEAAQIDGASEFTVYFKIVLPLAKAGLATIGLFIMVAKWNDWFTGYLYIDNPKLVPLQTMLSRIQKQIDFIKNNANVANTPDGMALLKSMPTEQTRMAILMLTTLPILCAYPFFQRYFIQGLTIGSVKG